MWCLRGVPLESLGGVCQVSHVMWMRSVVRRDVACVALTFAVLLAPGVAAAEVGPQGIVRQFCKADGSGQRVSIAGWAALEPLVAWAYEPAWDQVALITAYTVGSPQPAAEQMVAVDVRYEVVGQLSPFGLDLEPHAETVTYRVQPDEQGSWHILGPPPPPHIFANLVDIEAMRRSLSDGGVNFLADTVFVWQMFRSAGWNVPFESMADLLSGATYRVVDQAKPGDLVVYLRDEAPYHVGLLEAKNQVVSSTLNGGITRTVIDAFPGEVRYLRLVRTDVVGAVAEAASLLANTPAIHPTPNTPSNRPKPTATAAKQKRKPAKRSTRQYPKPAAATPTIRPQATTPGKRPTPTPSAVRKPTAQPSKVHRTKVHRKAKAPKRRRAKSKGKGAQKRSAISRPRSAWTPGLRTEH